MSRRDVLRVGALGLTCLSLSDLLRNRAVAAPGQRQRGRAKSCILLMLMGGPSQHSTWDPKPDAPAEIRGPIDSIQTNVPGVRFGEVFPRIAQRADKLCVLRAMQTGDNAHSSSGYYVMTGKPHQPMNQENANPRAPNDWPTMAAVVQQLRGRTGAISTAVRLPHRIFNTDGSVWPGQDSGFLGRPADPWLLRCEPGDANFRIPDVALAAELSSARLDDRRSLLTRINDTLDSTARSGVLDRYDRQTNQAFDLLCSQQAGQAFDLQRETAQVREQYGRSPFGQSTLLARRLIEAGVGLVQVNWYRAANEPSDNPCWDSHTDEINRVRNVLAPPADRAIAALLDDLTMRGMLDETLVVILSEFGRTPRFNNRGGREHWGFVFSIALAGGGVRGGQVIGSSDRIGSHPRDGRILPEDLTATIFHALGLAGEMHDAFGRPIPTSTGRVVSEIF